MNRRDVLQVTATGGILSIAGCTDSQPAAGDQIDLPYPSIGNEDAPLLYAFEDLGCPHCARFHRNIYPNLKEDYIDTGDVLYVFTDYVLPAAQLSSMAHQYARGVQDIAGSEQFFEYVGYLFNNQNNYSQDFFESSLSEVVNSEDDISTIIENARDRRYQNVIEQGSTLASDYGVRGTPRFVLNEQVISNVSPYSTFSAEIDSRL